VAGEGRGGPFGFLARRTPLPGLNAADKEGNGADNGACDVLVATAVVATESGTEALKGKVFKVAGASLSVHSTSTQTRNPGDRGGGGGGPREAFDDEDDEKDDDDDDEDEEDEDDDDEEDDAVATSEAAAAFKRRRCCLAAIRRRA